MSELPTAALVGGEAGKPSSLGVRWLPFSSQSFALVEVGHCLWCW